MKKIFFGLVIIAAAVGVLFYIVPASYSVISTEAVWLATLWSAVAVIFTVLGAMFGFSLIREGYESDKKQ